MGTSQENSKYVPTNTSIWTRSINQVVEHLPSKYKALSSNPSTATNKKLAHNKFLEALFIAAKKLKQLKYPPTQNRETKCDKVI
jgi:hypothetical protein